MSDNPVDKETEIKPYPVVAIGSSAGGLEAMIELLENLSPTTGMAYIYIPHLDPSFESKLTSILAKATRMKVQEATSGMRVLPDNIYIIPPNREMELVDGHLRVSARTSKHLPIDRFLISLSEVHKDGAIGVLLSGNLSDGTAGLKAIKSNGGLTYVQDESAKFQSMPKSAISEGVADLVLSPVNIAKEVEGLSRQKEIIRQILIENESDYPDTEQLNDILKLLKKTLSVDFGLYKINTIRRRIIRRLLLNNLGSIPEYFTYLKQHTQELTLLYQDLLINVTCFFRDPDAMEFLKKIVFPNILKSKQPNEPVRIWVPACSTGEEAYSYAMIFLEVIGDKITNTPVQIFASDLSESAISKARLGMYSKNDLVEVSAKRIQRFFTKVENGYRITKNIRDLCVFAPHNVLKDPPFSKLDFISCCNLMIYLEPALQKKLLATFHYSLNNNGILALGKVGDSGRFRIVIYPGRKKI